MAILQDRIKERRQELGLTLAEIAEQLGVKEATMQRYESGEIKNIKHETIFALSQILKCNPSYLMGWSDEISEKPNSNKIELTAHEIKVINAYRANASMRAAVDRLLGIEESSYIADDIKSTIESGESIFKKNSIGTK